jgi:hypothetical protein
MKRHLFITTTASIAVTAATLALSADATHAYNVGVKFLDVDGVADQCDAGWALPCTPGAGDGEANVLYVTQEIVDGYHRFDHLAGTGVDDALWLAVDYDAGCRSRHHLVYGWMSADLDEPLEDGWTNDVDEFDANAPWGTAVDVGSGKNMATQRLALQIPLDDVFDESMLGFFTDADSVLDRGEVEIEARVEDGMTYAEARAIPFELQTEITVAAGVRCDYSGWLPARYEKSIHVDLPLTIRYLPVDVPAPGVDTAPGASDLQIAPQVDDVALAVVPDPDDPCVLHLSGTIQTNQPTSVEYRFIDPTGHISNTETVDVDHTQTAFVLRTVQVPAAPEPEPIDELIFPGQGPSDDEHAAVPEGIYTGTFTIETVSPNHESAADGFQVPYCENPPVRTTFDLDVDVLTGGANPTHTPPTEPPAGRWSDADGLLDPTVGVTGETVGGRAVGGVGSVPRPTTELGAPVVGEGLGDLGVGVHDERALLGDRLADRASLHDEELDVAVGGDRELLRRIDHRAGGSADR